jgi:hypothetical protein
LLFEIDGVDTETKALAADFTKAFDGKMVLGVVTHAGIPTRPEGPALACRIKLTATEASVQIAATDATARNWVPFGKYTQPVVLEDRKLNQAKFADALAEGILNRVVRAQIIKGSGQKEKGKLVYQIKLENASPLILNGLAFVGTATKEDEEPKVLSGIAIPPRRSVLVPTPDETVKSLGLKKGIKILALDLSAL